MATYYKYQNPSEIGAAPTLDWGTVINNVNQNLQSQEQQRYENREADKKLANDILTEINNISQSSDPTLGALIQNHAADIKFNTFNRLKLVQENKDSRSNYNIFKQNTSASIASLDKFVKNWEPTYKAMSELRAKGLTTKMADAAQDLYGGFQNFRNKKLIQNQSDGFTYTVDIDPETNQPRNGVFGILPFETLNNIKNFTDLKVNLTEKAASFTDKMKAFITVKMKDGVRTLETPNQIKNKNYAAFLDNAFNSIAFNDNVIADILTNYSDWKPNLTDYKESSPTDRVIAGKLDGGSIISDITPAMRDEAKKIFEKQLLSQVKYEETPRAEFAPSRGTGGGTGKDTKPQDIPSVGKVVPMYGKTTNKLQGPAFSVSNIRINKGPGLMQEIGGAALRDGQLVITGYLVEGKETASSETDYGKGGFTVTKKTKFMSNPIIKGKRTKAEGLWSDVNGAQMEDIITRIPIPEGQGETFSSVAQAIKFLEEKQQGMSPTRPVKNTEYTNITETNKGTIGVKNGKWYNIKTGKPIQ